MPGSSTFTERDPSEAVALVDRKLLDDGLRVFRTVEVDTTGLARP